MGVSMLPRFAAMVSSTMVLIKRSFLSAIVNVIIENGTKVSKATSFVMNMLEIKQSATKMMITPLEELILFTRNSPICLNTFCF